MGKGELIAIVLACFVLAQIIIYFVMTRVIIKMLMKPKKRTTDMLIEHEHKDKNMDLAWLDIPYKAMYMQSDFGYKLFARLYINSTPTDKFIFCLHGLNNSSIGQLKYLNIFLNLGYNVLLPDHRRSGESGGDSITFGCYEKRDTVKWIDLIQSEYPNATFAVFGESMGAATATMVATDKRIRFLIEYCGFASFKELVRHYVHSEFLIKLLMPGCSFWAKAMCKVDLKELDALSSMKRLTDKPVMIIHSKIDSVVGFNNALAFAQANPNAKTYYFEDTIHARSAVLHPDIFCDIVTQFVKEIDNK